MSKIGSGAPESTLTAREKEIAILCAEGLLSKEIADRLNISQRTVETHKNNIFKKLGINSTVELVQLMNKLK
ncbi:MAG: helix-turn-helix transcriptional regulator [Bacteroidales bacterium]|nr:helix-turn-helix transcriptional regulator [Bacteroidales bacterium]MDO4998912.1 helix-turn-helix transcriptional regulator [Bacteroidales bacterium]